MTLRVFTARVSYGGPDRFDVTRKSGGPEGEPFAPSWKILQPFFRLRKRSERAWEDAGGDPGRQCEAVDLQEAAWTTYVEAFTIEMRESFRTRRPAWDGLLARGRVVLVCYCTDPLRCHRTLLARDILPRLGATYGGELPADEQRRARP